MHGRSIIKLGETSIHFWFNNFAKIELAKLLLPKEGVFFPKPEEIELLDAIFERANENHLLLVRDIIWSGILGHCFVFPKDEHVSYEELSELIATSPTNDVEGAWVVFMEAMGMNLEKEKFQGKKKAGEPQNA